MSAFELALPRGHVLATLHAEHHHLLGCLGELGALVERVAADPAPPAASERETLVALARTLIGAEPHHRREEEVLFPVLESRGLFGPPRRLRYEHAELRALEERLLELALALADASKLRETKRALAGVARSLGDLLREHIRREDEVLYPLSLQVIDAGSWDAMRERCDRIGYCPFTPGR